MNMAVNLVSTELVSMTLIFVIFCAEFSYKALDHLQIGKKLGLFEFQ